MNARRYLIVTADDFGIGPNTTRGILDLARQGAITCSVLLVNSPHAAEGVRAWRQAGRPLELGWHPCLTLDRPLLPAEKIPSLVDSHGGFRPLGKFLLRLLRGKISALEVEAELRAQYQRFRDLVGQPPSFVNGHHHVHALPVVGAVVRRILGSQLPAPFLRRVQEPWSTWLRLGGGRCKRAFLRLAGRASARRQHAAGFPGNDWLAGMGRTIGTDDLDFFTRWLGRVPGQVVELMCHPGYRDQTLLGRDVRTDPELDQRFRELCLLKEPAFLEACGRAGFTLAAPHQVARFFLEDSSDAA